VEKKDEKLKKKRQKVFKKGEKRGKVRKIEKNDAKRCALGDVFSKSGIFPVSGAVRAGRSWWRLVEMLKWVRWVVWERKKDVYFWKHPDKSRWKESGSG